jgi:hypothetical protein
MQDVHGKLIPGLSGQKQLLTRIKLFASKLDVNLNNKLVMCCIWSTALCDTETWTPQIVDQKHFESLKNERWKRMEKIIWPDRVKND